MSIYTILSLIVLGFFAGVFSGMVGIGGGIILVPALVALFGLSQHTAQGTTLAMLSLPVAAIGAYQYYTDGKIDIKFALIIAIGFVIGGYFGGKIAVYVNAFTLKKIFGVLLLLLSIKYLFIDK